MDMIRFTETDVIPIECRFKETFTFSHVSGAA
jgi:hypothetical protein